MSWSVWFKRAAPASLTGCPDCGRQMVEIERFTMSGDDRRSFRCERCKKEHILDFGTAMWKLMSDANKAKE